MSKVEKKRRGIDENNEYLYNLKKINIAILDSGCCTDSKFFEGIDIRHICSNEFSSSDDNFGHGTFVLSNIVNVLKQFPFIKYKIFSVKVTEDGMVHNNTLVKGLNFCYNTDVDVVYIGSCNSSFDNEIARLIYLLAKKKIIVVLPSGNNPTNEATYPSCLSTTISCGLSNQDGTIYKNANSYKTDVFLFYKNAPGLIPKKCRKNWEFATVKDGIYYITATSFSAAFFTGIVVVIKFFHNDIDVFKLRKIIREKYKDGVIVKFSEFLMYVINKRIINEDNAYNDMKYIKINAPTNLSSNGEWTFTLYTLDGEKYNGSGILDLEIFKDVVMKECVYKGKIKYISGEGRILPLKDLYGGIYILKLSNKIDKEMFEGAMSMCVSKVLEPYVICYENMVYASSLDKNNQILYTVDGSNPGVDLDGKVQNNTKIYKKPIKYSNSVMKFATYSNHLYSQVVNIKNEGDDNCGNRDKGG